MTLLANLKFVAAKRSANVSPVVQRRNKLIKQLNEQIELAKAQAAGTVFAPTKQKKAVDAETGEKKSVTVAKRIKSWWWTNEAGKQLLAVRYGARTLELSKGKTAVEFAESELVATLELIKSAVEAGELDAQIESASAKVKANFK